MRRWRNNILILCTWLLVALCFASCRPRGILSSRQMREVIIDLHKTDALLQVNGLQRGHDEAENAYYAMVLERHGVTQAQFDSSLVWYTAHPQLFNKIYPKVLAQLEQERDAYIAAHADALGPIIRDERDEPAMTERQARAAIDRQLWQMRNGYPVRYWHEYRPSMQNFVDELLP